MCELFQLLGPHYLKISRPVGGGAGLCPRNPKAQNPCYRCNILPCYLSVAAVSSPALEIALGMVTRLIIHVCESPGAFPDDAYAIFRVSQQRITHLYFSPELNKKRYFGAPARVICIELAVQS